MRYHLIILENCKTCHGENFSGNSYLTSFKDLDKEEFLDKMYNYKSKKDQFSYVKNSTGLNQ